MYIKKPQTTWPVICGIILGVLPFVLIIISNRREKLGLSETFRDVTLWIVTLWAVLYPIVAAVAATGIWKWRREKEIFREFLFRFVASDTLLSGVMERLESEAESVESASKAVINIQKIGLQAEYSQREVDRLEPDQLRASFERHLESRNLVFQVAQADWYYLYDLAVLYRLMCKEMYCPFWSSPGLLGRGYKQYLHQKNPTRTSGSNLSD